MPDLEFTILSVKIKQYAAVPTLHFELQIKNEIKDEEVYAAALKCQVIIEATKRQYDDQTKENLVEVFGQPHRWEDTVKSLYWTTVTVPVTRFCDQTIIDLPIACSEDHITAAGKYFYSVYNEEVPLAFLFSGTLFYQDADNTLRITQVPWHKEAAFRMPAHLWSEMMNVYFPNVKWLPMRLDIFKKLYKLKTLQPSATIEDCLESAIDLALKKNQTKTTEDAR